MEVNQTTAATLRNNCIYANAGDGVKVVQSTVTANGNTICKNTGSGIGNSLGSLAATNNILAFNGGGLYRNGLVPVFTHNVVYGNSGVSYIVPPEVDLANITVDPQFVSAPDFNFRLKAGSPCIDAGDDSVVSPGETDIEGSPRIANAHVDIGAFEFVSIGRFTLADVALALRVAGGLAKSDGAEFARLNVVLDAPSTNTVDVLDASRIARKVVGLEANP